MSTDRPSMPGGNATPPPMGTYPPYYYAPNVPTKRRSVFSLIVILFLIVCLGVSALMNLFLSTVLVAQAGPGKLREEYVALNEMARQKIAVITVEGTILTGEGFVRQQIDEVMDDKTVKAVILRVNSPGGTITGSDYIYHYLRRIKEKRDIPLVVSMGGLAASGGYYISMAVGDCPESIFAEPTTWTGSLGVKIPHFDLSKLLHNWGIQEDTIVSHDLKNMGSFAKPMTEEERAIFQQLVNQGFDRFKEVIRSGRPAFEKDPQKLDQLATGQVFTAKQAVENGLVDRIGFLEDAVDRVVELAELNPDKVKVIRYKKEPTLVSILSGKQDQASVSIEAMFDFMTPKGYYLHTWAPDAVGDR